MRHPRIEVYCRCGAAWYGIYAIQGDGERANAVIAAHAIRCGPPVTPEQYERRGHTIRRPDWWWYALKDDVPGRWQGAKR